MQDGLKPHLAFNSFNCPITKELILKLFEAIEDGNQELTTFNLTQIICYGVIHDLYLLQNVDDKIEKSNHIKNLYREVVSIQFELKNIDFQQYMAIVLLVRRANNFSYNHSNYLSFVQNEVISCKWFEVCD